MIMKLTAATFVHIGRIGKGEKCDYWNKKCISLDNVINGSFLFSIREEIQMSIYSDFCGEHIHKINSIN